MNTQTPFSYSQKIGLCSQFLGLSLLIILSFTYSYTLGAKNILYSDYGKFYHSQRLFLEGKNSYLPIYFKAIHANNAATPSLNTLEKKSTPIRLAANLNPPFFTLITFPFALLHYPVALFLWTLCSVFAGIVSLLWIQNTLSAKIKPSLQSRLWLLIAFFAYFPTFATLQFGQVTLLLLPFLVLGWRYARHQQSNKAAFLLALAASIKPFFALFFLYFLLRKEYRALRCFVLTGSVCALIAFLFLGSDAYHSYLHGLQHITWAASNWNVSLYGVLLRLFGGPESNAALLPSPKILAFVYPVLVLCFLVALITFFRPRAYDPLEANIKVDLAFSMIVITMLLMSPLGWLYYFPLLSLPFLQWFYYAKQGRCSTGLFLILALCLLLSNIPLSLIPSAQITTQNMVKIFWSANLYFLVLLSIMGCVFLLRYVMTRSTVYTKNTQAISSALLTLMYLITFIPSMMGILNANYHWLCHLDTDRHRYAIIYQD